MSHTISLMRIEYYDEALGLWERTEGIGLDMEEADSRDGIERFLKHNPGLSFIARSEERLVGAVICGHDGRRGYLQHLAVERDQRGQGIGKALVDSCLDALRTQGIAKCNIFVYADNETGRVFWEKQGGWVTPISYS